MRWPAVDRLEEILAEVAEALARRHGLAALGMAPLLAAQARPYLEVARTVEWGASAVIDGVVGAEVTGELIVEGVAEPISFRADRLDRRDHGLAMVDYKTGAPPSKAKGEDTRHRHLLRSIATGDTLQGVAYALAAPGPAAEGRYLYLKPEIGGVSDEIRQVRIGADDRAAAEAFAEAVATIEASWRTGAMFPRMEEPDGAQGRACSFCTVAEACLRDDSEVRRRLVGWLAAGRPVGAAYRAGGPQAVAARHGRAAGEES